jgi:hypothetical protein
MPRTPATPPRDGPKVRHDAARSVGVFDVAPDAANDDAQTRELLTHSLDDAVELSAETKLLVDWLVDQELHRWLRAS